MSTASIDEIDDIVKVCSGKWKAPLCSLRQTETG